MFKCTWYVRYIVVGLRFLGWWYIFEVIGLCPLTHNIFVSIWKFDNRISRLSSFSNILVNLICIFFLCRNSLSCQKTRNPSRPATSSTTWTLPRAQYRDGLEVDKDRRIWSAFDLFKMIWLSCTETWWSPWWIKFCPRHHICFWELYAFLLYLFILILTTFHHQVIVSSTIMKVLLNANRSKKKQCLIQAWSDDSIKFFKIHQSKQF